MNDTSKNNAVRIIGWDFDVFCQCIAKEGYDVVCANRVNNLMIKMIREAWFQYIRIGSKCWYNQQNKNFLGIYIVMDAMIQLDYMKWLKQNNPKARIVFWYWNQIKENSKIHPDELKKMGCEVWSFNKVDCLKYDLKYNPTFYCDKFYESIAAVEHPAYKISFVGKDKGRFRRVMRVVKQIGEDKCCVHITANHFYEKWKNKRYQCNISYEETLQIQSDSEAILEIVPKGSKGLTLRTMDAMMMKKKLITNNASIKETDFYNPNNIYILSKKNEISIQDFLKLPYEEIAADLIHYYRVDRWVQRFVNREDANENQRRKQS